MPAARQTARQTAQKPAPYRAGDNHEEARLREAIAEALALMQKGDIAAMRAVLQGAAHLAAASESGAYLFGLFFFNSGDPSAALTWFDTSLARNSVSSQAMAGRGIVLHQLGRKLEALAVFAELRRRAPHDAQAAHLGGVICQELGRLDEALAAYDAALEISPDRCDSLVNRGVVLDVMGRLEEALAAFDKVAALRPDDATNLFNRGSVLQRLGRFEQALAAYALARRANPANPEIDLNCGNVLQSLGRFAEALDYYDAALQLRPHYAQAHYNRGLALQRMRRLDAALAAYEAAIGANPAYAEAFCNRGNVLAELGRRSEALGSFAAALQLKPKFVAALINRANVLFEQGHAEAALAACGDVLDVAPDHAQALCIRGAALLRLERRNDALASLDLALQARPDYPEAWLNRGNVLQGLGRLDEAIANYDRALELAPNYPEVISSRGVALKELAQLDVALAAFNRALELKPHFPDARNNRAGVLLLRGKFKPGFEDFELRWERSNAPKKTLYSPLPAWRGEPLEGRRILVWDEQGLGDLMHFARYLPMLAAAGAQVTFYSRKNMFRLLSTLPHVPRLIDRVDAGEDYDYQIALLSLPYAFGTERQSIPVPVPYLSAEPALVDAWGKRLGTHGYRIGICWHGNPKINLDRDVPLALFGALAEIPNVRLISLVKDFGRDDEAIAKRIGLEMLGKDFDQGPDSFIDTAAVMANLDLIVSSDTSIPHLAGALGRAVFMAIKYVPDWRWMADGDSSPWYPSMRLFRQRQRGEWQPAMAAIAAAVSERMAASPS